MERERGVLTVRGCWRGVRDNALLILFMVPFGTAFGVAARTQGLPDGEIIALSAIVFAAASQFAVLEIWGPSVPLLALVVLAIAVNARFVLMGAALYEWMRPLPWSTRAASMFFLTDANFATGMAARQAGERDFGVLLGAGLAIYLLFVGGTVLGVVFGALIPDPRALALDVVMLAFFAALLAGAWRGRSTFLPWGVAAGVALGVEAVFGPTWQVVAGALAGGIAGAFQPGATETASGLEREATPRPESTPGGGGG